MDATAARLGAAAAARPGPARRPLAVRPRRRRRPRSRRRRAGRPARCSATTRRAARGRDRGLAGWPALTGVTARRWPATSTTTAAGPVRAARPGRTLLPQRRGRPFEDATAGRLRPARGHGRAAAAALVDVDHDGDVDLVAGAPRGGPTGCSGTTATARFTDVTAAARLDGAAAGRGRSSPTDFDNRRDVDLLVVAPRRARRGSSSNLRDGTFRDVAAEVGLARGRRRAARWRPATSTRTASPTSSSAAGRGAPARAERRPRPLRGAACARPAPRGRGRALVLDYDNDGLLDLVALAAAGARLRAQPGNGMGGREPEAACGRGRAGTVGRRWPPATSTATATPTSSLRAGRRRPARAAQRRRHRNASLRVRLAGRVSNRSGVGAKVELRAGSLRQKLETSAATPAVAPATSCSAWARARRPTSCACCGRPASCRRRLRGRPRRPARRRRAGRRRSSIASPRRARTSSPGTASAFEFVTDFLGGGEMGYWHGARRRATRPTPTKYVRIAATSSRPRDGRYELRVTNELEETLFLDRARAARRRSSRGRRGLSRPRA